MTKNEILCEVNGKRVYLDPKNTDATGTLTLLQDDGGDGGTDPDVIGSCGIGAGPSGGADDTLETCEVTGLSASVLKGDSISLEVTGASYSSASATVLADI